MRIEILILGFKVICKVLPDDDDKILTAAGDVYAIPTA